MPCNQRRCGIVETVDPFTPGTIREIPDAQAEMERLAEARRDPPGRVWGVKHPRLATDLASEDCVTVQADGKPFGTREAAEAECYRLNLESAGRRNQGCCYRGVTHRPVYRDPVPPGPWRDA